MIFNHKFQVKPLSANAMTGRNKTYQTAAYTAYQNEIRDSLMGIQWPFGTDPVAFEIEAGLSNRGQDLDNIVKPVLDTYQIIYEQFNDNKVYEIKLYKSIVSKGDEYLHVRIRQYEDGESPGKLEAPSETQQEEFEPQT